MKVRHRCPVCAAPYDPRATPFPRCSTLDLLWRVYHPRSVFRGCLLWDIRWPPETERLMERLWFTPRGDVARQRILAAIRP